MRLCSIPRNVATVLVVIVGLFCCTAPSVAASGQNGFASVITDLPLMPSLIEDASQDMIFSAPIGRIVEVWAQGPVTAGQVDAFYDQSLPQLGWRAIGEGRFERDGELLRLDVADRPVRPGTGDIPLARVRFVLSPK